MNKFVFAIIATLMLMTGPSIAQKSFDDFDPSVIWQIGKAAWQFVEDNEPVVNVTQDWGGAIPKGIANWTMLEEWKDSIWDNNGEPFFFEFHNHIFGTLTRLEWVWTYKYNGDYKGIGKYVTQAMPVVKDAYAKTTEHLDCTTQVFNPVNYGSSSDPVGGVDLQFTCVSYGKFKKTQVVCHVVIRGDGTREIVDCDTGVHKV